MVQAKDVADFMGGDTFVMNGGEIGDEEGSRAERRDAVWAADVAGVEGVEQGRIGQGEIMVDAAEEVLEIAVANGR